jgi:hypothetical protein
LLAASIGTAIHVSVQGLCLAVFHSGTLAGIAATAKPVGREMTVTQ